MRTTTTLFSFFLSASLFAQSPYRPFPENDAGWVENHAWLQPSGSCSEYVWNSCSRPVYFGADTTIGGITYHRLIQHGYCSSQLINPPQPSPPWCVWMTYYSEPQSHFAFFRQDVTERKVYIYDLAAQQERLLYDFTTGLGTYPATYNNIMTGAELQVVALDSMELNDGWHRTWVLGIDWQGSIQDSAFCTVIEGVGSTFGLTAMLWPPFENAEALICHSVGNFTVYPFGEPVCDLTLNTEATAAQSTTLLALPNPTSEVITLVGDLPAGARYVAHDALGALIGSGMLQGARVDCSVWPAGVYALTVSDGGGAVTGVVRVVKE